MPLYFQLMVWTHPFYFEFFCLCVLYKRICLSTQLYHFFAIICTGMTEACSSLTFMTLCDPKIRKSQDTPLQKSLTQSKHLQMGKHVGKPAPHIEICIGNSNSNNTPSIGRILTRGLHVMAGYWSGNKTICTGRIEKGWFDTGDIGWIDENGDLWLMGREKDRIKSGGENVYPEEVRVENLILVHTSIISVSFFSIYIYIFFFWFDGWTELCISLYLFSWCMHEFSLHNLIILNS